MFKHNVKLWSTSVNLVLRLKEIFMEDKRMKGLNGKIFFMCLLAGLLVCVVGCSSADKEWNSNQEPTSFTEASEDNMGSIEDNSVKDENTEEEQERFISEDDFVILNTEVLARPAYSTQEDYYIAEEKRELSLCVYEYRYFEENHFTTLCQNVRQEIVRELIGKKEGDNFEINVQNGGMEYLYRISVLKHIGKQSNSWMNAPYNDCVIKPYKITGFLNAEGEESSEGEFYGYSEKSKNSSETWWDASEGFYTSVSGTSSLKSKIGLNYEADNLIQNTVRSTWTEGVDGYGIGESIMLIQNYADQPEPGVFIDEICIVNGNAKNEEIWKKNGRVKILKLYYEGTFLCNLHLEDTRYPQYFDLSKFQIYTPVERYSSLIFRIEDVYESDLYEDTCITGIEVKYEKKEMVKK